MLKAKTNKAAAGGGPTDRDHGPRAFVRRHGLISFYTLAYALSWLAWLPYILSQNGLSVLGFSFPELLGTSQFAGVLFGAYLGPLGGAFIVTAISEGRQGLRRWVGRLFRWGVNWRWYALALLAAPVVITVGVLVISPGEAAGLSFPSLGLLLAYLPFLLIQMITTGLAEEPGWRDFALVRHQRVHGPLFGTLILGVLWAVWHFPLFLTEWGRGLGGANLNGILSFAAFCIVFSVFITWIFNRTGQSLPVAMLAHVSVNNFASVLLFAVFANLTPSDEGILLPASAAGFAVIAVVLIVVTRGKLGYRGESQDSQKPQEPQEPQAEESNLIVK